MRPLPFVWPYAAVFFAVAIWVFLPESRIVRASRAGGEKDARSLQVILAGNALSSIAAYALAFVDSLQITGHRVAVFTVGIAIMIAASLLRRHCFRMLGESFTGDVRANADQPVVTRGAYSILRHPSYTAGILLNVGIGIALGSWGSALLMLAASLAVYSYRMAVEERALVAAIGDPYREFMRTRKRVIPFIY